MMRKRLAVPQTLIGLVVLLMFSGPPAVVGTEAIATKSVTVQPAGPRRGEPGSRYLNVEGSSNGRYASFGVLVFQLPKSGGEDDEFKNLTIRFVQSIPAFAKDGKVRFLLAEPHDQATDSLTGLKFDPNTPSGLGKDAFKAVHPLGSGTFTKVKTGQVDKFDLTPDEPGRAFMRAQIKTGGTIWIVVVPEDENVAATYFGASSESETNWPRLVIGPEPTK